MTFDDDAAIERTALAMIDCSLPKAQWTHAAHFAVALWILRHRPELAGASAMRDLICRYNLATGTANTATGGYHHTITLASMRVAAARLASEPADTPLCQVLGGLLQSRLGRSDWLLSCWRRETLFAPDARRGWVAPDRAPLPS